MHHSNGDQQINKIIMYGNDCIFNNVSAECIAEFAMGFIAKCCNKYHKCGNHIIVDTQYDFNRRYDYEFHKISYYKPKYFSNNRPTVLIYGEVYRLFCAECNQVVI